MSLHMTPNGTFHNVQVKIESTKVDDEKANGMALYPIMVVQRVERLYISIFTLQKQCLIVSL